MAVQTNDGYGNGEIIEHKKQDRYSALNAKSDTKKVDLIVILDNIKNCANSGICQMNLINQYYDMKLVSDLIGLGYSINSGVNHFGDSFLTIKWT